MNNVIYQNKWCRIVLKGTIYVLQSKAKRYNDQYFLTKEQAFRYIGVPVEKINN